MIRLSTLVLFYIPYNYYYRPFNQNNTIIIITIHTQHELEKTSEPYTRKRLLICYVEERTNDSSRQLNSNYYCNYIHIYIFKYAYIIYRHLFFLYNARAIFPILFDAEKTFPNNAYTRERRYYCYLIYYYNKQ